MTKGLPDDFYPDDLEPVPTAFDLVKLGMAAVVERTKTGAPSVVKVHPEGTAYLAQIMARNAEKMRAWRERRTQ